MKYSLNRLCQTVFIVARLQVEVLVGVLDGGAVVGEHADQSSLVRLARQVHDQTNSPP